MSICFLRLPIATVLMSCASASVPEVPLRKRFIYVRHAQSRFNSPDFGFSDLFTSDADLSEIGIRQAQELAAWVEGESGNCVTAGDDGYSPEASCSREVRDMLKGPGITWLTSNLKRALMTAVIVHRHNIVSTEDSQSTFHVLSSLQEVSLGIDAIASSGPSESPVVDMGTMRLHPGGARRPTIKRSLSVDASGNHGNMNSVKSFFNPIDRLREFCSWTKERPELVFGVVGHARWLRKFFAFSKATLKKGTAVNRIEKLISRGKGKLDNASVMSFEIEYIDNGGIGCRFVHQTTELVYGRLILSPSWTARTRTYMSKSL